MARGSDQRGGRQEEGSARIVTSLLTAPEVLSLTQRNMNSQASEVWPRGVRTRVKTFAFKFRHGATPNGTEPRVRGDEQGEGEDERGEGDEHVRVRRPREEPLGRRSRRACVCVPTSRDRAGWFSAGRHLGTRVVSEKRQKIPVVSVC